MKRIFLSLLAMVLAVVCVPLSPAHASPLLSGFSESETMPTLWMEEMTWTEVQNAIQFGHTNVLIPTAGIVQNGPHLPLYRSRMVVRRTANIIARELGGTLIAPVIDFVPQGNIAAREGNLTYPGTISVPAKLFADTIDFTIRSLHRQGFVQFFIIGDDEASQQIQEHIARTLNQRDIATYHIGDYYAQVRQEEYLRRQGFSSEAIGGHGGLRDTAEFMAVSAQQVREYQLGLIQQEDSTKYGVWGDTSKATTALGNALLKIKTDAAIAQICREAKKQRPRNCLR